VFNLCRLQRGAKKSGYACAHIVRASQTVVDGALEWVVDVGQLTTTVGQSSSILVKYISNVQFEDDEVHRWGGCVQVEVS
jgi:hypothetical protein